MTPQVHLDPITEKNVNTWLNGDYDAEVKAEIQKLLKTHPTEVTDAFYTNLSFGTAGLRGIMGAGTNRMNVYTVRAATQGLANYIKKQATTEPEHAVFIGYDSRHHSKEFAEESAKVLAANGIRAYLYQEIRPTPLVSFGCRFKRCTAAIMVTASHNPPEYNGYKVYWSDGGQVLPPHDIGIIAEVSLITQLDQVQKVASLKDPLITLVGDEVDRAYLDTMTKLQNYPQENQQKGDQLKVIYTALHGTGITLMPEALRRWGFSNLTLVEKQNEPDGNFPTAPVPNPEERSALALGIETLEKLHGDVLIATDPDADRVGIAFKHGDKVEMLNGNQIACICLEHVCSALSAKNHLPPKAAFVKSIVTTELFKAIANSYGRECFDVLTGFKYIAEIIRGWELEKDGYQYIFGGEESYGYLLGTQTRDKDALLAGVLLCEAALHAKLKGQTLLDRLYEIYRKYGVFYEKVISVKFEESKAGKEAMAKKLHHLRSAFPTTIGGLSVVQIDDYLSSIKLRTADNKKEPLNFAKSDVLTFWLSDHSKIIVRPSGTEPKIKLYCGVVKQADAEISKTIDACEKYASGLLAEVQKLL